MIVRREAILAAATDEVWRVVSDPSRLPAWWPGVSRVEEVTDDAWTKVFTSPKGKSVRADYTLLESEPLERLLWRQEVEESPFERILAMSSTELLLEDADGATRLTIALEQRPRGWGRFAPVQFRAAGVRQVEGAIDGLKELFGAQEPG